MPDNITTGISNISIYIPENLISMEQVIKYRGIETPDLKDRLSRAVLTTGQESIRFPSPYEDTATMSAQSTLGLFKSADPPDAANARFLACGTETTLDYSKPVASYVQGMLHSAGINLSKNISTFQVQHACASGTVSMLSIASMLACSRNNNDFGIVSCSDIARYDTRTTAEITQGAGSVSMLLENNPELLELDLQNQGFSSRDVDDFFRPVGSITAKVKGSYSMKCYSDSLVEAVGDLALRSGRTAQECILDSDYFVLHTPFKTMPAKAMKRLLSYYMGYSPEEIQNFLDSHHLNDTTDPIGIVGNLYTGSLYLGLANLLWKEYKRSGDSIVGKKILLASYGSGNTMLVIQATIADGAPGVISGWSMGSHFNHYAASTFEMYDKWCKDNYIHPTELDSETPRRGHFYLSAIREDGYREYKLQG
jgi:hydroxymethylglutaryl-CoA synthase